MHRPPKPGTAGSNPAAPATMSNHEIIHCGLENMDLLDSLQRDSHLLDLIGGVGSFCVPLLFDEFDAFDMDDD